VTKDGPNFILYLRVSSKRQQSGFASQRWKAKKTVSKLGGHIISEYVEMRSGFKGKHPELIKAIDACKRRSAKLIVYSVDRLSRNPEVVAAVVETLGERHIVFCDMPNHLSGPKHRQWIRRCALQALHDSQQKSERRKERWEMDRERAAERQLPAVPYPSLIDQIGSYLGHSLPLLSESGTLSLRFGASGFPNIIFTDPPYRGFPLNAAA
jgi:DNA invertase Pin-like site-specific DNA recombinase